MDSKGIKCPYCGRRDMLAVFRNRKLIEYRKLDTTKTASGSFYPYKNNWVKEKDTLQGSLGIRCMACQNEIEADKLDGVGDIQIDKTKGAVFTTDFWDKFGAEKS